MKFHRLSLRQRLGITDIGLANLNNIPIDRLKINIRTRNSLNNYYRRLRKNKETIYINELLALTEPELLSIAKFGRKSLNDLCLNICEFLNEETICFLPK
jgi:DNA-directed RNA polymerase alpha subunit